MSYCCGLRLLFFFDEGTNVLLHSEGTEGFYFRGL